MPFLLRFSKQDVSFFSWQITSPCRLMECSICGSWTPTRYRPCCPGAQLHPGGMRQLAASRTRGYALQALCGQPHTAGCHGQSLLAFFSLRCTLQPLSGLLCSTSGWAERPLLWDCSLGGRNRWGCLWQVLHLSTTFPRFASFGIPFSNTTDSLVFASVPQASYGVEDPEYAVTQLAQTTMRSELGKLSLDRVFRVSKGRWIPALPTSGSISEPCGACMARLIRITLTCPLLRWCQASVSISLFVNPGRWVLLWMCLANVHTQLA